MSFDWKGVVATVAPTLASAFGSPLAGVGVKMALEKLGIAPEVGSEEEQLKAAIATATPADLLKLKQVEADFKLELTRLGIKREQLNVDDRNSARGLAKEKGIWPQVVLSSIYTAAYFAVLYFFMTGQVVVPDSQSILFGSLIGILTAAQLQILNFWFGSSSGSKEKTAALAAAKAGN